MTQQNLYNNLVDIYNIQVDNYPQISSDINEESVIKLIFSKLMTDKEMNDANKLHIDRILRNNYIEYYAMEDFDRTTLLYENDMKIIKDYSNSSSKPNINLNIVDLDISKYASDDIRKYLFYFDLISEIYDNASKLKQHKTPMKSVKEIPVKCRYSYTTSASDISITSLTLFTAADGFYNATVRILRYDNVNDQIANITLLTDENVKDMFDTFKTDITRHLNYLEGEDVEMTDYTYLENTRDFFRACRLKLQYLIAQCIYMLAFSGNVDVYHRIKSHMQVYVLPVFMNFKLRITTDRITDSEDNSFEYSNTIIDITDKLGKMNKDIINYDNDLHKSKKAAGYHAENLKNAKIYFYLAMVIFVLVVLATFVIFFLDIPNQSKAFMFIVLSSIVVGIIVVLYLFQRRTVVTERFNAPVSSSGTPAPTLLPLPITVEPSSSDTAPVPVPGTTNEYYISLTNPNIQYKVKVSRDTVCQILLVGGGGAGEGGYDSNSASYGGGGGGDVKEFTNFTLNKGEYNAKVGSGGEKDLNYNGYDYGKPGLTTSLQMINKPISINFNGLYAAGGSGGGLNIGQDVYDSYYNGSVDYIINYSNIISSSAGSKTKNNYSTGGKGGEYNYIYGKSYGGEGAGGGVNFTLADSNIHGGIGKYSSITGISKGYGGGGGGSGVRYYISPGGINGNLANTTYYQEWIRGNVNANGNKIGGGLFGGGAGANTGNIQAEDGTPNTGGGGGAGGGGNAVFKPGGTGGSGVIIIRFARPNNSDITDLSMIHLASSLNETSETESILANNEILRKEIETITSNYNVNSSNLIANMSNIERQINTNLANNVIGLNNNLSSAISTSNLLVERIADLLSSNITWRNNALAASNLTKDARKIVDDLKTTKNNAIASFDNYLLANQTAMNAQIIALKADSAYQQVLIANGNDSNHPSVQLALYNLQKSKADAQKTAVDARQIELESQISSYELRSNYEALLGELQTSNMNMSNLLNNNDDISAAITAYNNAISKQQIAQSDASLLLGAKNTEYGLNAISLDDLNIKLRAQIADSNLILSTANAEYQNSLLRLSTATSNIEKAEQMTSMYEGLIQVTQESIAYYTSISAMYEQSLESIMQEKNRLSDELRQAQEESITTRNSTSSRYRDLDITTRQRITQLQEEYARKVIELAELEKERNLRAAQAFAAKSEKERIQRELQNQYDIKMRLQDPLEMQRRAEETVRLQGAMDAYEISDIFKDIDVQILYNINDKITNINADLVLPQIKREYYSFDKYHNAMRSYAASSKRHVDIKRHEMLLTIARIDFINSLSVIIPLGFLCSYRYTPTFGLLVACILFLISWVHYNIQVRKKVRTRSRNYYWSRPLDKTLDTIYNTSNKRS